MSRIGRLPVAVPAGVKVTLHEGEIVVEGPKGRLQWRYHPAMKVHYDGQQITVQRPDNQRLHRALHGLTRALIANMVRGVTQGFEKRLKVEGVGFQAALKGPGVELTVGYANRIYHEPPPGVSVAVPDPTTIVVSGIDKQKVGQFAAEIRASRKPEPYKGKGIRYENEVIRRKEGKSFASGK
jgi:large subunit ribosomal protein L6